MRIFAITLVLSVGLLGHFGLVPAAEPDSLIARAEQHLRQGEHTRAIALLERAVRLAPESFRARLRLAGADLLTQRYRESIAGFQTAIALLPPNDPKSSAAFAGLGIAYLHTGRYAAARAALQEGARLDPSKRPDIDPVLAFIDRRQRQ